MGQAPDAATHTALLRSGVTVSVTRVSAPETAACGPGLEAGVAHSSRRTILEGRRLLQGRVCGGLGLRGPSVAGSSSSSGVLVHGKVSAVGSLSSRPGHSRHSMAFSATLQRPGLLKKTHGPDGPGGPGPEAVTTSSQRSLFKLEQLATLPDGQASCSPLFPHGHFPAIPAHLYTCT